MVTCTCQRAACGKTFRAKQRRAKFCSHHCYTESMKRAVLMVCEGCGTKVSNATWRKSRRYCSHLCASASRRGTHKITRPSRAVTKPTDLIEFAPREPKMVAEWLRGLTDEQLGRVWLTVVVEQFGEGQRGNMYRALEVVRTRLTRPLLALTG